MLVLKLGTSQTADALFREAAALARVEGFSGAPRLYFAFDYPAGVALGTELRLGKSLLEWRGKLEEKERRLLEEELRRKLSELHRKWGVSHGDISPRNILARFDSRHWQVTFVDWEFSLKRQDQNVQTFGQYRGTVGFTSSEAEDALVKDERALEACLSFLKPDSEASQSALKRRWPWSIWALERR